jgi:hypothetical protein
MPTGNQVAGVLKTRKDAYDAYQICLNTIGNARVTVAGTSPAVFGLDLDIGGTDVRAQGQSLLDQAEAYVNGMMAVTPPDDTPVDADTRTYVQTAIDQTNSDLTLVQSVAASVGTTFQQDLQDLIDQILQLAKDAVGAVATVAATVIPWWLWLAVAGGIAAYLYFRFK